jgi:hypothetical protein
MMKRDETSQGFPICRFCWRIVTDDASCRNLRNSEAFVSTIRLVDEKPRAVAVSPLNGMRSGNLLSLSLWILVGQDGCEDRKLDAGGQQGNRIAQFVLLVGILFSLRNLPHQLPFSSQVLLPQTDLIVSTRDCQDVA